MVEIGGPAGEKPADCQRVRHLNRQEVAVSGLPASDQGPGGPGQAAEGSSANRSARRSRSGGNPFWTHQAIRLPASHEAPETTAAEQRQINQPTCASLPNTALEAAIDLVSQSAPRPDRADQRRVHAGVKPSPAR